MPNFDGSRELPGGRIFLANVGVNAAHRLVSPLREDGGFTLVTIPEQDGLDGTGIVRYGDVPHLRALVPPTLWNRVTHYDPEFETFTYGDNCATAPRAAALKSCRRGDWIFFIARLVGNAGPVFAVIGGLEVESILTDVRARPEEERLRRYAANAHVRRAVADARYWDGFWVFAGSPVSGLFEHALVVGRAECELLFRNRSGGAWDWRAGRTELQTIGSYTRSCRCVIDPTSDPDRARNWWALLSDRVGYSPWR